MEQKSNSQMTQGINAQYREQLIHRSFLEEAHKVIEVLNEKGLDRLEDLKDYSVQDLTKMGISEGSARILLQSL